MRACKSCGHETDQPNYCERCGAALGHEEGIDLADDALSLMLGLVCGKCDSYNEPQSEACVVCSAPLGDGAPAAPPADDGAPKPADWMSAPVGAPLATAEAMPAVDLKDLVSGGTPPSALAAPSPAVAPVEMGCSMCGESLTVDDKFCRACGTKAGADARSTMMMSNIAGGVAVGQPGPAATQVIAAINPSALQTPSGGASTLFFGAVNVQRFARLVLVKGASEHGAQWRLSTGDTTLGRTAQISFSSDPHLAPLHCTLRFSDSGLKLIPNDTTNGVFVSVAQKTTLRIGDEFVVGTQRLEVVDDNARTSVELPPSDDTPLLASTTPGPPNIMLRRRTALPGHEELFVRSQRLLTIGRSLCDINFPVDPYLSVRHAQIARTKEGFVLEDLGSRNGTYTRARTERDLKHGEAIMIGDQVMRVEIVG